MNPDLRVRPFFLHGETISMREFLVGAFKAEMGLQPVDPDLAAAQAGGRVVTPSGMVLDGRIDRIEVASAQDATVDADQDGVTNEIPISSWTSWSSTCSTTSSRDRRAEQRQRARARPFGDHRLRRLPQIRADHRPRPPGGRRETVFDPARGNPFNRLFATANLQLTATDDGSGQPALKGPNLAPFVVRNILTDFKRHDLGPDFHELNYDGSIRTEFLTTPLWGVGDTAPYGHDGRSMNLEGRHPAPRRRGPGHATRFARLSSTTRGASSTSSTRSCFPAGRRRLQPRPRRPRRGRIPQFAHGRINLGALFNNPADPE